MATNKKITELTAAGALTGSEPIEVVQGGLNVQTTTQDIANLAAGGVTSVNGETGAVTGFAKTADVVGIQDLFIPASAMWPRVTGACAPLAQTEMATSFVNIQTLDFDQTTQEFAQFQIVPPRKWNNGTVTAVPYWTAAAGTGTVRWTIAGGVYRNDDALTVALGVAQNSDDTLIATNDLHIGPETSAITFSGTGLDGNLLMIQVSRDPANDTLSADAKLIGVSIRFTCDAAIDG